MREIYLSGLKPSENFVTSYHQQQLKEFFLKILTISFNNKQCDSLQIYIEASIIFQYNCKVNEQVT